MNNVIWIPETLLNAFPKSEDREGNYKHEYSKRLMEIYNNERGCSSETPDDFRQLARFNREDYSDSAELTWMAEVLEKAADLVEELV